MPNLTAQLAKKTTLNENQINILTLLDKGDTIPFIARYRKELTGGADDEQLRVFHDVYTWRGEECSSCYQRLSRHQSQSVIQSKPKSVKYLYYFFGIFIT